MFSDEQPLISAEALPPAPIEAILSFSLGDLYPNLGSEPELPNPPLGTAPASKEPKKKYRLVNAIATSGL
jgi:hypothetical protein